MLLPAPFDLPKTASGVLLTVLGLLAIPGLAAAPPSTGENAELPSSATVARVGQHPILVSDLYSVDRQGFDDLALEFEREQNRVRLQYEQSRYDLLRKQLDQLLDQRALESEATARGVSTGEVLADLKPIAVTEAEVRALYEQNKERVAKPYESVADSARDYLNAQRNAAARRAFYDELRRKHGIVSDLGPFRVPVAASGPTRGPAGAPITIIEFGDFQCPFCKKAEATLHKLLANHPQEVRLVFRQLPLTRLHPNALEAAKAAICANRQDKFWAMHDAMYEDQSALATDGLKETAAHLGLNAAAFSSCLEDPQVTTELESDQRASVQLGLTATPFFYVNGRPVDGNVPLSSFESIIGEELQQKAKSTG
jgi:protein-disulfide isomerase